MEGFGNQEFWNVAFNEFFRDDSQAEFETEESEVDSQDVAFDQAWDNSDNLHNKPGKSF